MGTRNGYSPEQRDAREQADRVLRERARELLADPAAVAAMVTQLVTVSRSPRVLGYSLRNQALLVGQARERRMTMTDVDSFRGWRDRGRCVRTGERGLRIVAPRGTDTSEDTEPAEEINPEAGPGEPGETSRARVRMVTVFDISQTDGVEGAEVIGQARDAPNPAAALRDSLTDQLARRGFTVMLTDTGEAEIDQHDRIVRLPATVETHQLPELARTVAQLLTSNQPAQLAAR